MMRLPLLVYVRISVDRGFFRDDCVCELSQPLHENIT